MGFKKNTNDSRESAASLCNSNTFRKRNNCSGLRPYGCNSAYENGFGTAFEAQKKTKDQVKELLDLLQIKTSVDAALTQTDAAGIVTEWDEFAAYDWKTFLNNAPEYYVLLDGRSLIEKALAKIYIA